MAFKPFALPPALPSELLEYVLTHQCYPTTLIICQTRGVFLSSLLKAVKHTSSASEIPPESNIAPDTLSIDGKQRHTLLIPTLHQVATSRFINLVFIPTVTHLRAYLAVFPGPDCQRNFPEQEWEKKGTKIPLLIIYGVVDLHKDTSEWSAQGLGNSLAGCVEAGWRSGRRLVAIEERKIEDGTGDDSGGNRLEVEPDAREVCCKLWEDRVPMLNGSVRRAGLESEEGGWSGRTVEVGRVLARWFKFRKGDRDNEGIA